MPFCACACQMAVSCKVRDHSGPGWGDLTALPLAHPMCPAGTFYARERLSVLFRFVREALQNDWLPFELRASGGQKLEDSEALALNECGLVSGAVLMGPPFERLLVLHARGQHFGPNSHCQGVCGGGLILSQCLGFHPVRWGGYA